MFYLWRPGRDDGRADTASIRICLAAIDTSSFSGPWASVKDRSPVRRKYSRGIVRVLFEMALKYSEEMVKADRPGEAERTLQWLEQFEANTEEGRVSTREITILRNSMRARSR